MSNWHKCDDTCQFAKIFDNCMMCGAHIVIKNDSTNSITDVSLQWSARQVHHDF